MSTYEVKYVTPYEHIAIELGAWPAGWKAELNKYGADGWELVCVENVGGTRWAVLMRPVLPAQPATNQNTNQKGGKHGRG